MVSRSRVRQALVCPYCRDELPRRGIVACARRGCGALYHRGYWNECAEQRGACAVMGCGSARSREVSGLGYALRWLRVLFPPRLVRALVRTMEPETAPPFP